MASSMATSFIPAVRGLGSVSRLPAKLSTTNSKLAAKPAGVVALFKVLSHSQYYRSLLDLSLI